MKPARLYVAACADALHAATALSALPDVSALGVYRLQRERGSVRVFQVRSDDQPIREITGELRASLLGELGVSA